MVNLEDAVPTKQSMFDYLCCHTSELDSSVALDYHGKKYTFGELKANTLKAASALQAYGVKKGDKVILSLVTSPESIPLMYACGILGAVPVLADVRYSKAELTELCDHISPKIMFLSDWQGKMVRHLQAAHPEIVFVIVSPCIGVGNTMEFFRSWYRLFTGNSFFRYNSHCVSWKTFIAKADSAFSRESCETPEDSEIIFTTSGTTGKRKYVILSSEKINLAVQSSIHCGDDYSKIKALLSVMPLFTCYGWTISIHFPLSLGVRIIISPIYNDNAIPSLILKKKPNAYCGVPHHFETIMKSKKLKKADLSFIQFFCSAGESFSAEKQIQLNRFLQERNCKVCHFQAYGMTETTGGACKQSMTARVPGSVGTPLPGVKIKIVDEVDGVTEVLDGMCGEVCIHSPSQTSGYYRDEEATKELIKHHPDGIDWIHTGDLGHIGQDGNLFIDGRKKRMIVTGNGTKVFLQLVEDKVNTLPGVTECAVVSYIEQGTDFVRRLALFLVSDKSLSNQKMKQNVLDICKGTLPDYLMPNEIVFCDSIPRNSAGKHDLAFLEKEALRRSQKEKA